MRLRTPYIGAGTGADGARRSAQIDQDEADTLPPGEHRDHCLLSAQRWILQAELIDGLLPKLQSDTGND